MELESDETTIKEEYPLPEGVKEPQVFNTRHGLNDSPKPETETEEITIEDGTDREPGQS